MNCLTLVLSQIDNSKRPVVGGKAAAVAIMNSNRLKVPKTLCVTTEAFDRFVKSTGLYDKILMEYYRKSFDDMRWEEIWDLSLRIKNMFLNTRFPLDMSSELKSTIEKHFDDKAVVVRSSGTDEDSAKYSFAGIHESYVNIKGVDSILKHIKLVWASLFSDSAILYRKETGLDVSSSKMAVVIQAFVNGEKSGVAFCKSPNSPSNMMIESVYGLNQGLVDGTVEPDRWVISRSNGNMLSYTPAIKSRVVTAESSGITTSEASEQMKHKSPLNDREIHGVYDLCKNVEKIFKTAQDTEWTYLKRTLYCLQSRPITTKTFVDKDDKRQWYLSLKRSLDNLKGLRCEIQQKLIPEMQEIAVAMESVDISLLNDIELADELTERKSTFEKWRDVYWDKFIPFAHGVRLFGEIYNKQMSPEDPYEFTQLLVATEMKSLERNRMLKRLAAFYNSKVIVARKRSRIKEAIDAQFEKMLNEFLEKFRNPMWGLSNSLKQRKAIIELLKQMGGGNYKATSSSLRNRNKLEAAFVESFPESEKSYAYEILDLARISYQLRDDDNIYLGKIEGQLDLALNESQKRLGKRIESEHQSLNIEEAILALKDPSYKPNVIKESKPEVKNFTVRPRQLTGQPSSEGLVSGKARIIRSREDVFKFKAGEILVCDAIDPNMTFIVPMAAGIVERRGGMLIHGAIIAREYGLPCITGVSDAVDLIENGQEIVVDGYLGIVTLNKKVSRK
jgi:phosphoenolpyruvate synthase/pyruvate phosphate dikinase